MKRDAIDLGKAHIPRLFRTYFLPTLLGMLSTCIVTAIDGIFVGHGAGSDGVAAVNIAYSPLMLLVGLGLMLGMGCSVVSSIHLSRGAVKTARYNVSQAIATSMLVLIPNLLVELFIDPAGEAARIAVDGLPTFSSAVIFYIFNLTAIGYFQSVERVRPSITFALMRRFLFVVPSFILMPLVAGTTGIWLALGISEFLTTLCIVSFYLIRHRTKSRS